MNIEYLLLSKLILVLFILLVFFYIWNNYYKVKRIFLDLHTKNKNKRYKVIKKVFSKNECSKIINEGIEYANINNWSKKRHDVYPTTDNIINEKWKVWPMVMDKIKNIIYPEFEKLYNLQNNKLEIFELFIVKYDVDGQRELEYHEDGSDFSFIVTLNTDFTGGGTTFKNNSKKVETNLGDCLIFNGQNIHKGNYIHSGTRYILTGFIDYETE